MKNDFIEINDKQYRVEFNWESITVFLETEGLTLADVDDLRLLQPRQITGLIYSGICEGCSCDGIKFPYTIKEFSKMIQPYHVGDIVMIYARQTTRKTKPESDNKETTAKKKKLFHFQR